jgi:hypothetical protein
MEKLLSGEGIVFLLRPLIVDNPHVAIISADTVIIPHKAAICKVF